MNYAKYLDLPNWKQLQQDILNFTSKHTPKELWWSHSEKEIEEYLPNLNNTFLSLGLHVRQMIIFCNKNNNINITDYTHASCLFIHTDSNDSKSALGTPQPDNIEFTTDFNPSCALNIPLTNCEGSQTLWYDFIDNTINSNVFYPAYDCGGHNPNNLKEVYRFELIKPAVIRINVPHAVYNPNDGLRTVATFRFYEDLEQFLTD
jgi:hypothetical protein